MEENKLYEYLYSMGNLTLAWRNARKEKTRKDDVIDFEKNLERNLLDLHYELKNKTYKSRQLTTFVLRDPKTRVISKSDFRDRVIHHALILVIARIFEKGFIYDSCANQIGKGSLFAIERFRKFSRKISKNFTSSAFCFKADIKHYFKEVDYEVLLSIFKRKIRDENIIWLIEQILSKGIVQLGGGERLQGKKGMPLGNLTSQFFANVYLNELDYFVKNVLRAKYYIRYVDDFIILHKSRWQLLEWKVKIDEFLGNKLKLELHSQKSKIVSIYRGIDFVGFRIFPKHLLLRKRNLRNMKRKIELFRKGIIDFKTLADSYQGWQAYARWANTWNLINKIKGAIIDVIWKRVNFE